MRCLSLTKVILGICFLIQLSYAEEIPLSINNFVKFSANLPYSSKYSQMKVQENQNLGRSVDIEGTIMAAGAPGYSDLSLPGKGIVYVLEYESDHWKIAARLSPSVSSINFGYHVAIQNDTIVVVSQGMVQNDKVVIPGCAFVYVRPASGWQDMTETARLTPSDDQSGMVYGSSLDFKGDAIAIGTLDYYDFDYTIPDAPKIKVVPGKIYVYEKPVGGWKNMVETAVLSPVKPNENCPFGRFQLDSTDTSQWAVAISPSGKEIAAGGLSKTSKGSYEGCVYLFEKKGLHWLSVNEHCVLSPSEPDYSFGKSVVFMGDMLLAGGETQTYKKDIAGTVYQFNKPSNGWISMTENQKIQIPAGAMYSSFCNSFSSTLDCSENFLLASSPGFSSIFQYENGKWVIQFQVTHRICNYFNTAAISREKMATGQCGEDVFDVSGNGLLFIYKKTGGSWLNPICEKALPDKNETDSVMEWNLFK